MRHRNYLNAERRSKKVQRRKIFLAAGVVLGGYLIASFILGEMGLVKYFRMKAQYHSLSEEITHLRQENAVLSKDVRSLTSDPVYIERLARDKLGLARPGEIVYYYGKPRK